MSRTLFTQTLRHIIGEYLNNKLYAIFYRTCQQLTFVAEYTIIRGTAIFEEDEDMLTITPLFIFNILGKTSFVIFTTENNVFSRKVYGNVYSPEQLDVY